MSSGPIDWSRPYSEIFPCRPGDPLHSSSYREHLIENGECVRCGEAEAQQD